MIFSGAWHQTMAIAALLIATAIPLLFLYLIRTLDLYGTGSPRAILFSFTWGALSVVLASTLYRLSPYRLDAAPLAPYAAPLLEETLKALILLYLVRRPNFTYFVDGAIYGFAVGIGFAVFENYLYILQNLDAGLGTALGRVLSTNLMHASAGAIVGIALGLSRFQRFSGRLFHLLSGLLLAFLLHAAFNRLVTEPDEGQLFLYATGVGLSGLAFTALTIRRGLAREKTWISETLGLANRVSAAEATAAGDLHSADTFLTPLAKLFGSEKAAQIEKLLLLQAQLGILRKTRDRAQHDEHTYHALSLQIDRKQAEMETVRRSIGAYIMASLRMLFPDEGSPLWHRLQASLNLRAAEEAGQDATENLFTLVERRSMQQDQKRQSAE